MTHRRFRLCFMMFLYITIKKKLVFFYQIIRW
jgi:hypothetical protein